MENQERAPKRIPANPGVYFFKNSRGVPLYIGKAENLKQRLASYWLRSASQKTRQLIREATSLSWQETDSEIEALILEARLIKQHRPKYNVLMRDDKNYFYVGITQDQFPKIFITHQPAKIQKSTASPSKAGLAKFKINYFGPYTSGTALKTTLRLLRKIFPYCTCKKPHARPCLNAQIGRCLGFCCNKNKMQNSKIHGIAKQNGTGKIQNLRKIYKRNIQNIAALLRGKKQILLKSLKKEMLVASQKKQYEIAAKLRDQIAGLTDVFSHRFLLEQPEQKNNEWTGLKQKLQKLFNTKNSFGRIEAYDISNISGSDATGSMVVFTEGEPEKKEYRKFRIKTVAGANDVAMLKEVIRRRMRHPEWRYPDLIVIDGGKPQLRTATSALSSKIPDSRFKILITALAKKEEELYIENRATQIPLKTLDRDILHLFQVARDEAHRFAKKYHHTLRTKNLTK